MAIAKTLQNILDNQTVSASLDRTSDIDKIVEQTLSAWRADLSRRHPAPAYIDGIDGQPIYQGTDMDLFTVLMSLSQRRAVINFPEYERLRVASLRSNEYVISRENRHGQILRLTSNSRSNAFSAFIKDFNVVRRKKGRDEVGSPRNFAITDDLGQLYDGWQGLEWHSSEEEDSFIRENELETFKDTIEFNYFVHPALASAFFGSRYLEAKTSDLRIGDKIAHCSRIIKDLREQGIRLPFRKFKPKEQIEYWTEGEKKPVKVKSLEAKLKLPDFKGEYPVYGMKEYLEDGKPVLTKFDGFPSYKRYKVEVLRYCFWELKKLNRFKRILSVPIRAAEVAFLLYGFKDGKEINPGWDIPEVVRDYKETAKSRSRWNLLEFNSEVQLFYRIRETTARISV